MVFSNRDHRSLLDQMVRLLDSLAMQQSDYLVADAAGKLVRGLLAHANHLVTRVRRHRVAFFPAAPQPPNRPRRRGRPLQNANKIQVASLWPDTRRFQAAPSPVYAEQGVTLRFRCADRLWRPVGIPVRFVAVLHPLRGAILLRSTDLTLQPLDIIRIYGLNRSLLQASHPRSRCLCLSLLHGRHDAPPAPQRQPFPRTPSCPMAASQSPKPTGTSADRP